VSQNESRGPLADKLPTHQPPPELERRVLETLAKRGLVGRRTAGGRVSRAWRTALMIAAGMVFFASGALWQRVSARGASSTTDVRSRYALLLYGALTESAEAEQARVDEYRRWLGSIAADGRYVAGEKLRDGARELTSAGAIDRPTADAESLAGFFIVSASTPAEAESIARSCPHIRHGGKVVLRAIDPT
jgi:hypothetical protein